MSIVYDIDKEKGITYVIWDGVIMPDEYLAHARRMVSDADWPSARFLQLIDIRSAVLDASFDESAITKVNEFFGKHIDRFASLKVAILANEISGKTISIERLMTHNPVTVIVFYRLDIACIWLGTDAHDAEGKLQELHDRHVDPGTQQKQEDEVFDISQSNKNQEDLKIELLKILRKIKDPDIKHEEFIEAVERLGIAWDEFIMEKEKNKIRDN